MQAGQLWPPGSTILVVEDDESVSSMLGILLEMQGWHCTATRNAEEGWQSAFGPRPFPDPGPSPAAAIVDLRLPGRDGWWLLERIRESPGLHTLPMLLITGFMDDAVAQRATELSCECLGKPFTFSELLAGLERAVALAGRL